MRKQKVFLKTVKTPNIIEQEINKIRIWIYEKTKDLSPAQRTERVNKIGEVAARKYGFKIVASANDKGVQENRA